MPWDREVTVWFLLGFGLLVLLFRMPTYTLLAGLTCFGEYCYLVSFGGEANEIAMPRFGWILGTACLIGWLIQAKKLYQTRQEALERTGYRAAAAHNPEVYHGIEMLSGALSGHDHEATRSDAQRMLRDLPSQVIERHWNGDLLDLIFWVATRTEQDALLIRSFYML